MVNRETTKKRINPVNKQRGRLGLWVADSEAAISTRKLKVLGDQAGEEKGRGSRTGRRSQAALGPQEAQVTLGAILEMGYSSELAKVAGGAGASDPLRQSVGVGGLPWEGSAPGVSLPSAFTTPSTGARSPSARRRSWAAQSGVHPRRVMQSEKHICSHWDCEPQACLLASQQEHVCPVGSDQGSQREHPMGAGLPVFVPSLGHNRKPFAGMSRSLSPLLRKTPRLVHQRQ